ncbi:AAA domain protein [Segatella baroniae F0067]|uniref:AAA domain protein n=2 Tax=Segatella baroniae TaxID=305719 RepID=U2NNL5_9BACT|nr:AAA domain protein [Segatella baroniae F0067]
MREFLCNFVAENFFSIHIGMIITIARQCGCGALEVGKLLAARYDIPFYTRKSLMQMAKDNGVLGKMHDFFEERPVDELMYAISAFENEEGNDETNHHSMRLLANLIGRRDCVIIGRCGNYIFRNRADLVSVFLKGNFEERVKAMARCDNMSLAEAEEFVRETDDSRVRYHKYYTGLTWGNADDYDICFDSLRLGTEKTALLIGEYVKDVGL